MIISFAVCCVSHNFQTRVFSLLKGTKNNFGVKIDRCLRKLILSILSLWCTQTKSAFSPWILIDINEQKCSCSNKGNLTIVNNNVNAVFQAWDCWLWWRFWILQLKINILQPGKFRCCCRSILQTWNAKNILSFKRLYYPRHLF